MLAQVTGGSRGNCALQLHLFIIVGVGRTNVCSLFTKSKHVHWLKNLCIDKYETSTTFVHHCLGVFMCYSLKVNTCDAGEQ